MQKKAAVLILMCACIWPLYAFGGDDLAKLGKARRDAAEKAYKTWLKDGAPGVPLANERPISVMTYQLSLQWLNADLDLSTKKEERIAAYGAHLQRIKHWEAAWVDFAAPESFTFVMIRSFQREAEYWLAKERFVKK